MQISFTILLMDRCNQHRQAFDEIFLRYRVLAGVGTRDTTTTVLGQPVPMPVLVAPSAFHCLAHPLGERAAAAAVAMTIAGCGAR